MPNLNGVKKRSEEANYINVTPNAEKPKYAFMGTGFTALDESPNAQTSSKQYINDDSATQNVTRYEPSWSYSIDQIKDQEAVTYLLEIGKLRKTGVDTITDILCVDLDQPATDSSGTQFHARKQQVAVAPSNFGNNDGEMTGEGSLLGRGDVVEGVFDLEKVGTDEDPFTEGWTGNP